MAAAAADGVHLRLFGAFEIHGAEGSTALAGVKQRAIVSRLAIDAGRVVSGDQLVDAVWGDDPPATVRASLQVHVSQIRKALAGIGAPDVLVTRPSGYELDVPGDAVDVLRFERLASDARAGHGAGAHERTLDAARQALALWIGPPLAGAAGSPFVETFVTRLDGSRLELIPVAAGASISLGRASEMLPIVESMIAEQPYSESLWASAARLLYAQGRQADALDRLATVRRVLREELGLDPAPATSELERQILVHDPSLPPGSADRRRTPGDATSSKLPPMRPLIGRDALIEQVALATSTASVVTLVGPGGVGKTSLAVHVAAATAKRDGACFVDLTHVATGQDPLSALIASLGMVAAEGTTLDEVVDLLAGRDQLLVFDNCEHVLDQAASIIERFIDRSGITVIATSREPLDIDGELVIDVPALSQADGVELFVRRAQAGPSGFAVDDHDLADLQRIVELVGGLPLALELASPLVRLLSPAQIVEELSSDRSPAHNRRARHDRHASMHNAVAWSYELLDPDERRLFERLSVFEGGTDLSGVLDVCRDDAAQRSTLDALAGLVARSLVSVDRTSSGMRYRMLVPIQSFARRKLEESGEARAVRRKHVEHVIERLRANARVIESDDPAPGLTALELAAPNIRAAYTACRADGDDELAADVVASISVYAVPVATALPELLGWIRECCATSGLAASTEVRLLAAATLHLDQSTDETIDQGTRAIALAASLGNVEMQTLARLGVAHAIGESDNVEARRLLTDALDAATATSNDVLEGLTLHFLANHMVRDLRLDEVVALLDDRLAFGSRRFGMFEAAVLYQHGRTALEAGQFDRARARYLASLEAGRRTASRVAVATALFGRAQLALSTGNLDEALAGFRECYELDRLVDPKELWADSLMIGITAYRLRRVDIVDEQLRSMSEGGRHLVTASLQLLAAFVAQLNGSVRTADGQFHRAAMSFASMHSRTHLRAALQEWARFHDDRRFADHLEEVCIAMEARRITTLDAMEAVDAYLAAPQPT